MNKVNKETLKLSAEKLMFEIDDSQYDTLIKEFNRIVLAMEEIGKLPHIDEVEPMIFPFEVTTTYLREDVPEEPLSREDALKNCQDVKDGQIKLPKVVK